MRPAKTEFIKCVIKAARNVDCEAIAKDMAATGWKWLGEQPDEYRVADTLADMAASIIEHYASFDFYGNESCHYQQFTGGFSYAIEYFPPDEFRITFIHGHSGEADNINE